MNLKPINFDSSWTLFLDRDGVINRKIDNDYVKKWEDFQFNDGVLTALNIFAEKFNKIVVVTNQQGIGKGLFSEHELSMVHEKMLHSITSNGGRIDKIYFCPALASENSNYRKPNPGMGLQAKLDFPEIDFAKSIIVGDSISDMEFGKRLGMKTVFINTSKHKNSLSNLIDWELESLESLALKLS